MILDFAIWALPVDSQDTVLNSASVSKTICSDPVCHSSRCINGVEIFAWHAAVVHHHSRCHACAESLFGIEFELMGFQVYFYIK